MSALLIPADALDKLVCLVCKNYLSLFPVYTKTDSLGAICGRCKLTEEDDFIHDKAYENLAQFLSFPCCYKHSGCKEQFTPLKLEDHEEKCNYRIFDCPANKYSKCKWQGPCVELREHFERDHPSLIIEEAQFELSLISSCRDAFLIPFNNKLFLLRKKVDILRDIFSCSMKILKSSENDQQYNYFLSAETENKNFSCTFPKKNTFGEDNITIVNTNFLKEKFNDPAVIIIKIHITEDDGVTPEEEAVNKKHAEKNPNINWDFLVELECPVCYDFMIPPIYQCIDGHSICKHCKPKLSNCPLCKKQFHNTKNFTLEKLTQHLIYPCKYHKMGCNYASKSVDIEEHEPNCNLGPYDCPLKDKEQCTWKSHLFDIEKHIDNNHHDFILDYNQINVPFNVDNNTEESYIIKFSGKIFKLSFTYANEEFYWIVQMMGSLDDSKMYKFEIDVVDNSGNKLRRYLKGRSISILETINDALMDSSKYLMMTLEQARPLITSTFSFTVLVVKD